MITAKLKNLVNLTSKDESFFNDFVNFFNLAYHNTFGFKKNSIFFLDETTIQHSRVLAQEMPESYCFLLTDKKDIREYVLKYGDYVKGFFIAGEKDTKSKMTILLCALTNKEFKDIYPNSFNAEINFSNQKNGIVEQLEKALGENKHINPRLQNFIINTLDELLLNAIFDAPIEISSKKNLLKNIARDTIFILEKPVYLSIVMGTNFFALSVEDKYGSFDFDTLKKSLLKNPVEQYNVIDDTISQGAGLGISLTFNRGASLAFVSSENNFTKTIAYFPLCDDYKHFKNKERFLLNLLWKN